MICRGETSADGLFIARRDRRLVGAVWGEIHAGRAAFANPPQLVPGEPFDTGVALLEALEAFFAQRQASFYQVQSSSDGALLEAAGLRHATDLLFLASEIETASNEPPPDFQFEPYRESEKERLAAIIESTYRDSLDVPELDGLRSLEDVLEGYRHTGRRKSGFWRLVRRDGRDIGCLLLTEHLPHGQWELVYMGVTPDARGRGAGRAMVRYAQQLATAAGGVRLLLAVDVRNRPALKIYSVAGFHLWRRRSVFLKTL